MPISRDSTTVNINGGLSRNENCSLEIAQRALYITRLAKETQLKQNYINRGMKLGGSGKTAGGNENVSDEVLFAIPFRANTENF